MIQNFYNLNILNDRPKHIGIMEFTSAQWPACYLLQASTINTELLFFKPLSGMSRNIANCCKTAIIRYTILRKFSELNILYNLAYCEFPWSVFEANIVGRTIYRFLFERLTSHAFSMRVCIIQTQESDSTGSRLIHKYRR